MISCVIVEDNQIDTDYLISFIRQYDMLKLKASFLNGLEAHSYILEHQPQLVFLDIDMPVINGMDFFRQLQPQPICIFVTAHSEYAWEGFEAHAFDFILKPVKAKRFAASMARLEEYIKLLERSDIYESQIEKSFITIKEGTSKHVIDINDIMYIEALKDYSKVVTEKKNIMTLSKLKHFIDKLPPTDFVRIHRSYAVAVKKIEKVDTQDLFLKNIRLPIGKTYRNSLKFII
ncbi:MAG TPA: LytTR family DNA-binding domain-containing protein [Flavisolibacter sp.]|nr:LytTR family DNA-binding domain-containing protein [Flavisolibacter sp.]